MADFFAAGICFGLDAQGRVYCVDGCNWKATAADYADYPQWTSARQSVLDYFEGEAHRELDMIRDGKLSTYARLMFLFLLTLSF